jgi:hypothetical protein
MMKKVRPQFDFNRAVQIVLDSWKLRGGDAYGALRAYASQCDYRSLDLSMACIFEAAREKRDERPSTTK